MKRQHDIPAVRKNQIIPLSITGMTAEGNGVGHFCGLAVFVPQTAVGDELQVRIVKVQKNYAYGIIAEVNKPSPDRIPPDCAQFSRCGGCVFRHVSYEAECRYKEQIVTDAFTRIGKLTPEQILPILGAEGIDGYRNKAQFPFAQTQEQTAGCFGFYAPRSHRLIPVTDCALQPDVYGEILQYCEKRLNAAKSILSPYHEETGTGVFRHLYLRQGYHSKEIMVCFITASKTPEITKQLRSLGEELMRKFPLIRSVMLNVNSKQTNVILGAETHCLCGAATISDSICGIPVILSPESFYQVNTAQAERLFAEAEGFAAPQPSELLLDLYCGTGVIGLSMAKKVRRLIGVEVVPQAIINAKANALRAGIDNAEFFTGDAGQIATQLASDKQQPDIIILDPPRKGCSTETLDACVKMSPKRIVMISCNPATAARDAAYLCGRSYSAKVLRAVDMFPRTGHVECVILLSKD